MKNRKKQVYDLLYYAALVSRTLFKILRVVVYSHFLIGGRGEMNRGAVYDK